MSPPGMLTRYEVQPVEDEQVGTVFDAQQCFSVYRINMDLHRLREGIPSRVNFPIGRLLPSGIVRTQWGFTATWLLSRVLSSGPVLLGHRECSRPSRTRNLPSLVLLATKAAPEEG